jgi:DNA invertase Pin-like site-specific DNA recombinase
VYDPRLYNDRLLLGLKGTMSEAELHVLRLRLQSGILNKARRGELILRPPIGYAYDANAQLVFDPDLQIQQAVRLVFDIFRRTGSALATVRGLPARGTAISAPFIPWYTQRGRPLGQTGALSCASALAGTRS